MRIGHIAGVLWRVICNSLIKPRGPNWTPVWKTFSAETGGEIRLRTWGEGSSVRLHHRGVEIVLTSWNTDESSGTKFQSELTNPDGYRFTIRRKGLVDSFREKLGWTPYYSGDSEIDDQIAVFASSDELTSRLLRETGLLEELAHARYVSVGLVDKFVHRSMKLTISPEPGVALLQTMTGAAVTDIDVLRFMLDVHRRLIDGLVGIGVTVEPEGR